MSDDFKEPTNKLTFEEPTGYLRLVKSSSLLTDPGKLQMQWRKGELMTNMEKRWTEYEWRDVPVVYSD